MKKVLIITYYWPPSGGSGVQRWAYFCKYLIEFGIYPIVITVDENKASYRYNDYSLNELVKDIEVHKTKTIEPLRIYSRLISGDSNSGIPIGFAGESKPKFFQKITRAIRGNFFIPDARIGWVKFAYRKAKEIIEKENINIVITNGPPHSTHLVGLRLKKNFRFIWMADFRDPWTELHYNRFLYRTKFAQSRDARMEYTILNKADILLTVGPSMKKHLIQKGNISEEKVSFIYNGYDENDFEDIDFKTDPCHFTISHIGMLSDSQPITTFLEALKYFRVNSHPIFKVLKLRLIGSVSHKNIDDIKAIVPDLIVEHVDYVPKKTAISYMMSSDLLFNSLAEMKDSELLISGKLMEYIAAGKPVLCLGNPNGDAAALLKEFKLSAVFDRNDIEPIVKFLETIFDNWLNKITFASKDENIKHYSRFETTRQLANLLNQYL